MIFIVFRNKKGVTMRKNVIEMYIVSLIMLLSFSVVYAGQSKVKSPYESRPNWIWFQMKHNKLEAKIKEATELSDNILYYNLKTRILEAIDYYYNISHLKQFKESDPDINDIIRVFLPLAIKVVFEADTIASEIYINMIA